MQLDHERLDVYQKSLEALDLCNEVLERATKSRAHHRDQLERAATSIVLNIAEGAGEFSRPEKRRFYRMARRSATESAALIQILERRGWVAPRLAADARAGLARVIAMLVRLIMPI